MNTISQSIIGEYIKTHFKGIEMPLYLKENTVWVSTTLLDDKIILDNLYIKSIDSNPTYVKTHPIICCTDPSQIEIERINIYNKTLIQHNEQHILCEPIKTIQIEIPFIISKNIDELILLTFNEMNSNTIGIAFRYDENNKKIVELFELFETNDIISSWGEIFIKNNIKSKIIFVRLNIINVFEVYLIENSETNNIFDSTFKLVDNTIYII